MCQGEDADDDGAGVSRAVEFPSAAENREKKGNINTCHNIKW